MADNDRNDDVKARMREALERKKAGAEGTAQDSSHTKAKGPTARGPQGGGNNMFRRKSGG
jgi:hypothetical protein